MLIVPRSIADDWPAEIQTLVLHCRDVALHRDKQDIALFEFSGFLISYWKSQSFHPLLEEYSCIKYSAI